MSRAGCVGHDDVTRDGGWFVSEQRLHDAVAEFPEPIRTTDSDWAD